MDDAHSDGCDVVRPVIIDSPKRQLLLIPSAPDSEDCWTLPTVPMRPGETIRRAATRHLRRDAHLPALRIPPLIGRLSRRDAPQGIQYVVVVRPAAESWSPSVRFALAPEAQWWTTAELRSARVLVEPAELLDFMDGYWDGWLPDGEISLE
ncbi:NUDIX domain-containing protein [Streptomyces sp. NPDC058855]|uniref:NUDIX domain-containing protein n=1 Tax=Streptomyces sp. NPDC058855 TaxID=3346651 RepID=UPI0036A028D0